MTNKFEALWNVLVIAAWFALVAWFGLEVHKYGQELEDAVESGNFYEGN